MLRRFALEQDVACRIKKVQNLMKKMELGAIFIVAGGGPGLMGMAKYLTNLVMWAGRAYVVLGAENPEPALIQWSSYGSSWNRQEATTSRIENGDPPGGYGRAIEIARELAGSTKRIGVEHVNQNWTVGEWDQIRTDLPNFEFVDITEEVDAIRSIKSNFEIENFYDMGRIMTEAFLRYEKVARPGVRAWDAAAAAEEVLKAAGCYWGRQKYSLDLRPYTFPTPLDRKLQTDDIILFELVYCSPMGYWCEMTSLYTFKPLPKDIRAQVEAQEKVIAACAQVARAGERIGKVAEVSNQAFKDLGFPVIGLHTPHCHSIGLDESDGPSSWFTPDAKLQANMVLSFHPSTLLEGDRAFLVSDNYLVTPDGAVRLSPKSWTHKLIEI